MKITISPSVDRVSTGDTVQFSANVTGGNKAVTWSTNMGSITAGGLFTASSDFNQPTTGFVKATSNADPSVSATATVTVNPYL